MKVSEIYGLLLRLGVTANYIGFFQASYAIYLAIQQPERLLMVTKWLYPEVARHYQTSRSAVERNIRTVIDVAWENSPDLLQKLALRPLKQKPTAGQFIAILAAYYLPEEAA